MLDFEYCPYTKVAFGRNSESKLAAYIGGLNASRVLLHYGGGSAEKSGLLAVVRSAMKEAGVKTYELGGVVPNPRLSLVKRGIELCKAEGIDAVLAVGGGSVIDSAKAIAMGAVDDGDVWDFYLHKRAPKGSLPVGVVLTMAAAGSETSWHTVITNDEDGLKLGFGAPFLRPAFAILNPELTRTLPAYQTACGVTDILMHTMERYFTSSETMRLTDGIAESLLRTVIANAKILMRDPENYQARAEIMWAGSLSHNDLTQLGSDGGDWTVHGTEHELSGLYDVAHGAGLASLWGSWARYVYANCLNRFHLFAMHVMGVRPSGTQEEIALKGIEAFEEFLRSIGMPTSLTELGVDPTEEEFRFMAKRCIASGGGKRGSAKVLNEEDIYNILKAAK